VILYGQRWGMGLPPEDTYSVTSNLERLQPLHTVAEALIAHLVETYEVDVSDDLANVGDIIHTRDDIVRAVRLTPRDLVAAPLTFVFTSLPSVIVHAGALTDFLFPVCGCDACDDGWERVADEMEWNVLTVVAGGFSETLARGYRPKLTSSIAATGDRRRSSLEVAAPEVSRTRRRQARSILARLGAGWVAWSRR
jgi:hypothetical protein